MATHLVIDGYNLLAVHSSSRSETAREALLQDIAAYRHRKGHAITIVFDGWRQGHAVEGRELRSGVEIIYSKRGEKADQVVQRLARRYGAGCAVVSSDREIVATAHAHGAFVMEAQEFAGKLRGLSAAAGLVPHKELDRGDDLRPNRGPEKKGNPRKLPKAMRRRERQLRRF